MATLFSHAGVPTETPVEIQLADVTLCGDLFVPAEARGIVLFAHGSGSSRHSSRNRYVAEILQQAGIATLLFDLLTTDEEWQERYTRHLRFDIPLLSDRLGGATVWLQNIHEVKDLPVGYFGASTGGGAAIVAAAELPNRVTAVVSRGGRPDLAGDALEVVQAPVLLIVGGDDDVVLQLNREAMERMKSAAAKKLEIIPGATHLFEEPGTLEQAAEHAKNWFVKYL
jgi:alpha-beta hydrolase superfamily lysophospholipase